MWCLINLPNGTTSGVQCDPKRNSQECLEKKIMSSQHSNGYKYSSTVIRYMHLFLDVLSPILDVEYKENNENENLAFVIYTLFLSTLECYSSVIFAGILSDDEDLVKVYGRTVDLLVKCTDKPGTYPVDESCSTLAMEFWYLLQDEVLSMPSDEKKVKRWEAIKPVYVHIVKVLIKKSQLPNEKALHKWNSDDLETFRCYRQDIGDTLLSCHDVLNDLMLDVLSEALDESIAYLNFDPQNTDNWPLLEATIHAYCSIAQKIEYAEYPQIVKLLKVLNEIPYEKYSEKLLGMALETAGAYSDWISDNPKYLPAAIELLVRGLSSSQASQATLGLKDLTSECQKEMAPFALPLLDACRAALQGNHLKNSEMIRLMYTVGNIISYESILHYLDLMVSPCFEELQMNVQNQDTSDAAKGRVILRLEMIAKLFSSLNTKKPAGQEEDIPIARVQPPPQTQPPAVQPILLILEKTMVLLKTLCTMWLHDESVIETLCTYLKLPAPSPLSPKTDFVVQDSVTWWWNRLDHGANEPVCNDLGIICETDYFGLIPVRDGDSIEMDECSAKQWINLRNPLSLHANDRNHPILLSLRVKFWVPAHLILQDSVKRLFYMQARQELLDGHISPSSWENAAHVSALLLQADGYLYDPNKVFANLTGLERGSPLSTIDRRQLRRPSKRKCSESDVKRGSIASTVTVDDTTCETIPKNIYQSYIVRPKFEDIEPEPMPENFIQMIAKEHETLTKIKMTATSAQYWLLEEISTLNGYGEELFEGVTITEPSVRCKIGVSPHGLTIAKDDQKYSVPFTAVKAAKSIKRSFRLTYMNEEHEETHIELKLPNHRTAACLYRAITEKHVFYSCETVRPVVTTQFIRDLKGTIVSMFNEDTELGKRYVFDIQRTCREVYDNSRRILHARGIEISKVQKECPQAQASKLDQQLADEAEKSDKLERLVEERITEAVTCIICVDNMMDTMFLPCGHIAACRQCAEQCDRCPLCRANIECVNKAFLPPVLRTRSQTAAAAAQCIAAQ